MLSFDFRNIGFNQKVVAKPFTIDLDSYLVKQGIQAIFFEDIDGDICRFVICGRSHYGNKGTDILSSGIAVLGINTINAIRELTNAEADCICTEKKGVPYMECRIYRYSSRYEKGEVLILLKALKLGIESIQDKYGKNYVTIIEV